MAGTKLGGRKAAITNKIRYGDNFYERIGRDGGRKSRGGGFTDNPELARRAGKIGGKSARHPRSIAESGQ